MSRVGTPSHELRGDPPSDWRLAIEEPRRRRLRAWLWSGAGLTFLILIIGGITRLTQSGLSIVDWQPIVGVIPPLNEAEWQAAFDRYREFPEYQKLRRGMSLAEFKFIFFWEYIHRVAARLIGLVFLIPFLVFWARGYFNRPLLRRVLVLFALGAAQGLMGWLMVKSGLVDRPHVSHFRLAAHLSLALGIFGLCVWLVRELSVDGERRRVGATARQALLRTVGWVGALLLLQILWGAFVAGLKAGFLYNTFPLMGGSLLPPGATDLQPLVLNLFENAAVVQWTHRVLGTLLAVGAGAAYLRVRALDPEDRGGQRLAALFAVGVLTQYALGILTLVYFVPVSLGVLHQAVAVVLLGIWLVWLHEVRETEVASPGPAPRRRAAAGAPLAPAQGR